MKKIIGFVLASLMVFAIIGFAGCAREEDYGTGFQSYVSLSINPAVEFFVDENGLVESVNATNEDGEIILSDYNLVGMNIKEAAQTFVDAATISGYINLDATSSTPNNVEYLIISEQKSEELENTVRNGIDDYFIENGIYGISRKAFMEDLRTSADELGISLGKYKLITRVLEVSTEYTIEELVEMEMKDIVSILGNNLKREEFGTLKGEFKTEILALKERYSNMFTLRNQMETLEQNIQAKNQQIDSLEIQLQNTVDENARIEIQNQINTAVSELEGLQNQLTTLSAEHEALHNQYQLEFETLRAEYKASMTQLKNQLKLQKQALMQQNQTKLNQHKKGVGNAERNRIKEWLNGNRD